MTTPAKPNAETYLRRLDDIPRYASEKEIALAVLGPERWRDWPGLVPSLEREGMPKVDRFIGARYWPAVRAWLDRRHGVNRMAEPVEVDGEENWP